MKLLVVAHRLDETEFFERFNREFGFEIDFRAEKLTLENVDIVRGYEAVAINASCNVNLAMAQALQECGVRFLLTRTAGYDHIDASALEKVGIAAAYVPAYSPNAISEHTVLLLLMLLRKMKLQQRRIDDQYFFIEGLRGRQLTSMTVGVLGVGRIGQATLKDLSGFGCKLLACDSHVRENVSAIAEYVDRQTLLARSDALILHCPMKPGNHYLIGREALAQMKPGALLVNTARGGLVDTQAVRDALVEGRLGGFAMDVYEHEGDTQRRDLRGKELPDPLLKELLAMDNVIFTSHTAFYTDEAIGNIVETTLRNLHDLAETGSCDNRIAVRKGEAR